MSRKQRPDLWRDEIALDLVEMPPYAWYLEGNKQERLKYWADVAKALRNGTLHEDGRQRLAAALTEFIASGGEKAKSAFHLNAGNKGSIIEELKLRASVSGGGESQAVLDARASLAAIKAGTHKSGAVVADAKKVKQARANQSFWPRPPRARRTGAKLAPVRASRRSRCGPKVGLNWSGSKGRNTG